MALPAILAGIGLGLNALGTITRAGAQRRQAQLDAFYAEQNAQLADEAATDARLRGAMEAGYHRMRGSYEIASARAAFGASGVDGSVGSAVDAMAAMRMTNELEALTLESNAAREARGYSIESWRSREQARVSRQRGEADVFSTLLGGAGDTAEGVVRVGNSYYGAGRTPEPYGEVRAGYGSGRGIVPTGEK